MHRGHITSALEIIRYLSDLIFPPRESEVLIRSLTHTNIDRLYQPEQYRDHVCLGSFTNPLLHALITENKFYHSERAADILATLLERWLQTLETDIVLVPIPLSVARERERGYNQVVEVLKKISLTNTTFNTSSLLKRIRHTTPQTDLGRSERIRNIKGAFAVRPAHFQKLAADTLLVLIDDVVTTGSTLSEARATLQTAIPPTCRIITVAFAH